MGGGDFAHGIGDGPGEGAFDVAEELALQQFAGKRRAVDGDERGVALGAAPMELAGQHAFAGAARSEEQIRRRASAALKAIASAPSMSGSADLQRQRRRLGGEVGFENAHAVLQRGGFFDLGEDGADLVRRERLRDEIEGPAAHGFDRGGDVGVGGEDHHGRSGLGLENASEDIRRPSSVPSFRSRKTASKARRRGL